MKARGVVVSIVLGIGLTILPAAAHALRVVIGSTGSSAQFFLNTEGSTLNLDCPGAGGDNSGCASTALGSPKTYDFGGGIVFTIARCTGAGCAAGGRARVFVSDGAVDTLVLTDAVIRNVGTVDATLTLRIDSDLYTTAGEAGPRAYAAELSGSFVPAQINPFNRVTVRALACFSDGEGISCGGESPRLVDSPGLDSGEGENADQYSIVAPPYKPAGTSQFSPKEQDIKVCPDFNEGTCVPALRLIAQISLKAGYSLRAPGSIGAAGSKEICDPNTPDNPERQNGCIAMAEYFAKLGPKGAQMYDVRLEPSPGFPSALFVRGERNSDQQWTAKDANPNQGGVLHASKVRATLETNGSGEVKTVGLCNVLNGCCPVSLPVRVYCADSLVFTTVLHTDYHGNGKVDLVSTSPCVDPAVLIMDESNSDWVAAPLVP